MNQQSSAAAAAAASDLGGSNNRSRNSNTSRRKAHEPRADEAGLGVALRSPFRSNPCTPCARTRTRFCCMFPSSHLDFGLIIWRQKVYNQRCPSKLIVAGATTTPAVRYLEQSFSSSKTAAAAAAVPVGHTRPWSASLQARLVALTLARFVHVHIRT